MQKFLAGTNMVAEQLQHLPSPHPFEHYLHVCFAVQSTNTSFLGLDPSVGDGESAVLLDNLVE